MNKSPSTNKGGPRWLLGIGIPGFLVAILLSFLFSISACNDPDDPIFNVPPEPEPKDWIFDLNGTAADNVFACGNAGKMFHFDGVDWTSVATGSSQPIVKIWDAGNGTLYACGYGGKIWRNSGSGWNSMSSGTTKDLFSLGSYQETIYAGGEEGELRKYNGSAWVAAATDIITRDQEGAPLDTLSTTEDLVAFLAINHFCLGGAYLVPDFEGDVFGINNTDGMILTRDIEIPPGEEDELGHTYSWRLLSLGGQHDAVEWILCSNSDLNELSNNYLGTSEGWLYQLTGNVENDDLTWVEIFPKVTWNPNAGIRDFWVDDANNLYMVTDEGQVVYQTPAFEPSCFTIRNKACMPSGAAALTTSSYPD